MTNIVILNSQDHRSLRVQGEAASALGDNKRFVQIAVTEFSHLIVQCPILLSKDADTGAFYCGAMLGFDEGENLFLREGKGHDGYRPLNLQRMPFYAAGDVLAIDLDHPRVSSERGERLFADSGEPTRYLQAISASFRELKPGLEMTKVFIATLLKLKLVEPIDINVSFDDGSKRNIVGLYTIDQGALEALPDDTVINLFRRGYLRLIDALIASLKQVPVLAQKKNARLLQASLRGQEFLPQRPQSH